MSVLRIQFLGVGSLKQKKIKRGLPGQFQHACPTESTRSQVLLRAHADQGGDGTNKNISSLWHSSWQFKYFWLACFIVLDELFHFFFEISPC